LLSNPFKSKGLGCGQYIVKATDDGKGGLTVVPNGNPVAVWELKVGAIPFKDVPTAFLFSEQDLRTEEANLEVGKVVSFALKSGNAASVVQDLIAETPFLEGDELPSDAIHGKRGG
jgi:hypothetical protein